MKPEFETLPLEINEDLAQFELKVGEHVALIKFKNAGSKIALIHTEVPDALAGTGAAAALVEKTLTWIQEQGKMVLPFCPFVFSFIRKHPDWKSIVDPKFGGYDKI